MKIYAPCICSSSSVTGHGMKSDLCLRNTKIAPEKWLLAVLVSQTSGTASTPSISIGSSSASQAALPPLESLANRSGSPLANQGSIQTLSSESFISPAPRAQGIGEAGVLGGAALRTESMWTYEIPKNSTRPVSNDSLAYLTV